MRWNLIYCERATRIGRQKSRKFEIIPVRVTVNPGEVLFEKQLINAFFIFVQILTSPVHTFRHLPI